MPFAKSPDGAEIHFEVHEPSRPAVGTVVLLQGLALSSRFWFDLPERLLQDEHAPYRVVLLDNRGVGKSRARPPYRMGTFADDVAAVLDAAGIDRAVVAGISMGGMIAQHVAVRHPARVEGLVLLATGPGAPHGRIPGPKTIRALVGLGTGSSDLEAFARLLLPEKHLHRAGDLLARWPAALRENPTPPLHFVAQLLAAAFHSTGFSLKDVRVPAIVVTGDEDLLVPPANSVILARLLPDAELHVLRGVGHAIPLLDEGVVHMALRRLRERRAVTGQDGRAAKEERVSASTGDTSLRA